MNWHTLHIFSYGDTQLISNEYNIKVKSEDLTKLPAYIELVKSKRPEEVQDGDYKLINTFNKLKVQYGATISANDFSFKWNDITEEELSVLNELISEIKAIEQE